MEPQNQHLPLGCTETAISDHLENPVEVDEERAIELASKELHAHMDNVVEMYDPTASEDQSLELDSDGQVAVKFEFTVYVDYVAPEPDEPDEEEY